MEQHWFDLIITDILQYAEMDGRNLSLSDEKVYPETLTAKVFYYRGFSAYMRRRLIHYGVSDYLVKSPFPVSLI